MTVVLSAALTVAAYLPIAFMLHPLVNRRGTAMSFTAETAIAAGVVAAVGAALVIWPRTRYAGLGVLVGAALCFVVMAGVCGPMYGSV